MLPHLFKNSMELELNTQLRTGFSTLFGGALHVLLLPDVVELSLLKRDFMGGFKVKVVHRQTIALVDVPKRNDQQAIAPQLLNKLITELQKPIYKGVKPVVVLSNYFARYLVLDWNEDIKSKLERGTYLKHSFLQHFGDTSKDWHLNNYLPAYGKPAIASGVSRALLQSVETVFEAVNLKVTAIHPMLMLAANQALQHFKKHKLEQSFWLACIESNRLTLALLEEGDWKLVHNFAAELDVGNQINTLIQRESVMDNTFSTLPIITINSGDVLINDNRVIKFEDEELVHENTTLHHDLNNQKIADSIQPKWAA